MVALEVFSAFTEWGATATDLRDGKVAARVVSGVVNTSAVTQPGQPIRVVYEATDSAGNVARRVRLVTVYDSCNATNEIRCAETLQCSVFKTCSSLSGKSTAAITAIASKTTQTTTTKPPDTIAPVVTVSPPGVPYATPNGTSGLITSVYVGDTYIDAGATATDEVPSSSGGASTFVRVNVLSSILSPAGAIVSAVSTDNPTGELSFLAAEAFV
ncbi:hypothetical protein GPECTOR_52g26 [Gonium pectorale]|uniref:HYR domain-containing protein n=1 Tax=Gonium pectorale TaxID=33097 RepID=A0A150G713_GONPE|nr:hypothetical protein GPECTOR_52g26 [Gonium pectorale]|eukprot:KXZ45624.1 hypothetical protein GPECTOR_52g26 [Gonium pectorale]